MSTVTVNLPPTDVYFYKIIYELKNGEAIPRRIRVRLVAVEPKSDVIIRRNWKKFGAAAKASVTTAVDGGTTNYGDPVFLKLNYGTSNVEEEAVVKVVEPIVTTSKILVCRFCGGPHMSTKCSHKDLFAEDAVARAVAAATASLGSMQVGTAGQSPVLAASEDADKAKADNGGKYIPVHLRKAAQAAEEAKKAAMAAGLSKKSAEELAANINLPSNLLRLSNLPDITTEDDIRKLCAPLGAITKCYVAQDMDRNRCRGFGYITFMSVDSAKKAVKALNGFAYGNNILKAEFAQPKA